MTARSKLKEKENTKDVYINGYLSRQTLKTFENGKSLRIFDYTNGKYTLRKAQYHVRN